MQTEKVAKGSFVAPMLLQPTAELPEGNSWLYELKLDGYRAIGFKTGGRVHLRSRNNNDFNGRYAAVAKALKKYAVDPNKPNPITV